MGTRTHTLFSSDTAQQPAQRKEIKKQLMIKNITYEGDEHGPEGTLGANPDK
jgi:hypothetical protein